MATTPPAGTVLPFPARPVPDYVPDLVQRELDAVERWCAASQAHLARLAYAERIHHLALRRVADQMRADILTAWHEAQPQPRK